MRKAQKRQIEEIIRQIEEAHDEMKRCIEQGIAAQELLADCQNAAIAIGTMIEDTEGEGHSAVKALEEYCEQVYRMHEHLLSGCSVNANKVYKSLRQKLIKASNSIRNDIKIRKETVFLPYKASMWDSLESVWKAADADPDCDAYVIPIPYFDKNPDGSFKEEHYEGNLYPAYVPVIRYDAYDLEAEHPDEIYIHNPYDECNYVTSVHPYFYAKNLRNYTDKLIYIPYFILGEIEPDNQAAIDSMKHFCFTPGTIYAHQVIVQSENMRQIYINEYIKAAKKNGLGGEHVDRKLLEKKFLGTGSPKIDKVLRTNKEDLEIPQEWLKIIKKLDGSRKKIILYNTSVGALLQHSEKMLAKMEWVFGIFKENKDEVVLLWRPHPLIQATIESMRPQLWEKYREIKDRYIEEGWGIYDNTSDVDRAVVLSDAYYGDASSVVALYQKTSKKVLLQNCSVMKDSFDCFRVEDFCCKDGWVFFLSVEPNALWKYSYDMGKTELVCLLGESYDYRTFYAYEDQIIIFPYYAEDIKIYHIYSQKLDIIKIQGNACDGYCANKYMAVFEIGNILYGVGDLKTQVLMLSLSEFEVNLLQEKEYRGLLSKGINVYSHRKGACVVKDSLFMALNQPGRLAEFNSKKNKIFCYDIPNCDMQVSVVVFDGIYFWLAGHGNKIIRWEKDKNFSSVIELDQLEVKGEEFSWKDWFSNALVLEDSICFAPLRANDVIKIDRETLQVSTIYKIESGCYCFMMKNLCQERFYIEFEDKEERHCGYEIDTDNHVCVSDFSCIKDNKDIFGDILEKVQHSKEICKIQLKVLIGDKD